MMAEKGEKGAVEVEVDGAAAAGAAEKGEKGAVEVGGGAAEGAAAKEVVGAGGGDMITLRSSDGKEFEVSKEVAKRLSEFLKQKISSASTGTGTRTDGGGGIQLGKVGSEALEKVVDYFNKHATSDPGGTSVVVVDTAAASKDLEEWDRELVDSLGMDDAFFDLVEAADFLGVRGLLDATSRKLAGVMKGKTPAQIRKMFNIENDYNPEEEQEIRRLHAWAFGEDW